MEEGAESLESYWLALDLKICWSLQLWMGCIQGGDLSSLSRFA